MVLLNDLRSVNLMSCVFVFVQREPLECLLKF